MAVQRSYGISNRMMAFVDLLIVSTEENRAHTGSSTSPQSGGNKEEASNSQGATRDCGTDAPAVSVPIRETSCGQ